MKTIRTLSGIQEKRRLPQKAKLKMFRGHFLSILVVIIIGSLGTLWGSKHSSTDSSSVTNASPVSVAEVQAAIKPADFIEYRVQENDIPAEIFTKEAGYGVNDVESLLKAAEGVFDLTKLTIGKTLRVYFENTQEKDRASRLEYYKDNETVVVITRDGLNFSVKEEPIQYEIRSQTAKGTIDNSFYVDALDAGLQEATILDVGDIFSSAIDFTTEIQQGDSFAFVYEERSREDKRQSDGKILAGKFVNAGVTHYAYYFEHDGKAQYYDQEGYAIQRQFLKAPLTYRYISSGFTGARMHPITKTVHAHYQIDYAAPTGTPVVATADGTLSAAGFEGGWGNIVRLTHENGYTTHYAHLSAFASGLVSGSQIVQGQIIGYVGSTGWSTGPHLDYGMKLNGAPLNPLELKQPKGERLPDDALQAFEDLKSQYKASLE